MKLTNFFILLILSTFIGSSLAAIEDDPDSWSLETIPFKFSPGKGLDDLMALRASFAEFADKGDFNYTARILVPWAVSKESVPIAQDWDAIWFGISPNGKEYSEAFSYYVENGAGIDEQFDAVRTMQGRVLLRSAAVFRSGESLPSETIRSLRLATCKLNSGETVADGKAALQKWSEKMGSLGAEASTFWWNPGIGASTELEGSYIIARAFPSVESWGGASLIWEAHRTSDLAEVNAGLQKAMRCSASRLYLSFPFYSSNS